MRKLLATICAGAVLGLMASCDNAPKTVMPYNQGINIIPAPVSLVQNEGNFKLNKNTKIITSHAEAKTVAEFFAAKMNAATGYQITVAEQGTGISLSIDPTLDVNAEGYTLDVNADGVIVKAKTPQGLFYGMQSFLQLLPAEIESPSIVNNVAWTAQAVSVKDEPRFGYRGIMLDASRHFIPVEIVKKQLDVLSLFKINRMHWHLTDDQGWRIEIKKYPELTQIGSKRVDGEGTTHEGFYTQEQIKEVVKYAADRFITIVPEIELPGHEMAAITAFPHLSCKGIGDSPRVIWGVEDIVMCAGKEEPFEFLENVIKEVAALFPGEYFHIGGDECPKKSWAKCPLCQARIRKEGLKADKEHTAEEKLQSYFVQRIEKVVNKYGKKMIGWDEILEGGLAPSATVMSWRGEKGGITAAYQNHDVIMTPGSEGMYLDHYQGDPKINPVAIGGFTTIEKTYKYNPTPDTLVKVGKEKFIKGVQCNIWTEYMYTPELMEYRIYPRILALSEIAWTKLENKNYKDFESRLDNAQVRLDGHDINYYIPQPEQPKGSCNFVAFTDKAKMEFKASRPVKMVYTLDGSEPTPSSTVYTAPFEITENTTVKIASVLPSGKMSKVREITVEKQALAPAKEVAKKTPGLSMKVAKGMYLKSSELANVKEWKNAPCKELRDITKYVKVDESMRGVEQFAAVATGYVNIPEDGVYFVSSELEEV